LINKKVLKKLRDIAGRENILLDIEDRICYSYDATNKKFLPDLVIFPENSEAVSNILKIANEERIPIIPRGAGSGFTGGSLPINGGIVLCMTKMRKIIEIDDNNLIAILEPGVITETLQKEVENLGLFYPPDPSSLKFSTMGGNVAECAGGPRGVKYGVTKDYVIGLEVVIPSGDIINPGVKTMKGVVGYDLTKLIVGSEGTLGIVTKIIVKLIPYPESVKTMIVTFPKIEDAAKSVSRIIASKIIPAAIEFIDNTTLRCVEEYLRIGLPINVGALLIIEVDGTKEVVALDSIKIEKICKDNGAEDIKIAKNKKESEDIWNARRAVSPAIMKLNPIKINEDIVVMRSFLPEAISGIKEIANKYNLKNANYGHAGDGNIHVNILIKDEKEREKAERAVKEIFELTLKLGGSISGEHGVGITKAPYLRMELKNPEIVIMKGIKNLFDPNNILNPKKIFE
jgi:glycolate oxidase